MRELSWMQTLGSAGVTPHGWRTLMRRKQVALAFAGGAYGEPRRYFDIDAAGIKLATELAPGIGLDDAATIIRAFSDKWLGAVGLADAQAEPAWLAVAESYDAKGRKAYTVSAGSLSEFAGQSI